jgi:hypothetical protein
MTNRGRIVSAVAVATGICVVYLYFFGVATMFALEARYMGWKLPVVRRIPVELTDVSMSRTPCTKLTYSGYEFEVPWDLDEEKTRQVGKIQLIALRSGNAILFSITSAGEFVKTFTSSANVSSDDLKKLYGEAAMESDYALHRRILEATPTAITPFSTPRDAISNSMLVLIKGITVPAGANSGIFFIRTPVYQGFQFGDPLKRPRSISIEIYTADGGLGFVFSQKEKSSTPAITQAEINRVIQTAHKITQQPSGAGGVS